MSEWYFSLLDIDFLQLTWMNQSTRETVTSKSFGSLGVSHFHLSDISNEGYLLIICFLSQYVFYSISLIGVNHFICIRNFSKGLSNDTFPRSLETSENKSILWKLDSFINYKKTLVSSWNLFSFLLFCLQQWHYGKEHSYRSSCTNYMLTSLV